MKNIFILAFAIALSDTMFSQILFSNSFGNLSLQSYTTGNTTTLYSTIPSAFNLINDGHNNIASAFNAPFNVPALKKEGWAVTYNSVENDTFLVSTSWLDSSFISSRWVITPAITNITANTVLTWLAKSPDAAYPDGYEVYGTNKSGVLTAANFSLGDLLFTTGAGGEKNSWTRRAISLGSYAGQTLRFAFKNNSFNKYQLWIDDIEVKNTAFNLDGSITSIHSDKYILTGSSQSISVTFSNNAAAPINTITLNYQYGNSIPVSQLFTFSPGLNYGQSLKLSFGFPYSFSSAGYYKLKAWHTLPNNTTDQNVINDTLITYITAQSFSPPKNVFVEQFVSAKDADSPDAQEKVLALQSSSVIVVNVHDNDSLKEQNSAGLLTYKKKFSTALIDRKYNDSLLSSTVTKPYYNYRVYERLKAVTPASVSIINKTYNSGTKQLTFTLKTDFAGEVKGDYRLNAYLVENNISGKGSDTTVNGFNQLNDYFNVPWSPYYQRGYFSFADNSYVLNAWQYKHQRVLIHSFNGSFGNAGLIPQTGGTQNQSYQTTFSYTLPTITNGINKYNADNIYLVGFIAEYSTNGLQRDVLNVTQDKLTVNPEVVGLQKNTLSFASSIYPNPASKFIYVNTETKNYEIQIHDLLGRCVFQKIVVNADVAERIDLTGFTYGTYILTVKSTSGISREKFIIQGN